MQGPSHLLVSWYLAESVEVDSARDRRIVAWAGFAPDFDVGAYVAAIVYYGFDQEKAFENVWAVVHHRYTHGLFFVALVAIAAFWLAHPRTRGRVAALAALVAALHCFFDVVAGGPTWPIYPFWPVSDFAWGVPWSWTIGEWPNLVVLYGCVLGGLLYARAVGRSPLECFGDSADRWLVRVMRNETVASPRSARQRWMIWICVLVVVVVILLPLRRMLFP